MGITVNGINYSCNWGDNLSVQPIGQASERTSLFTDLNTKRNTQIQEVTPEGTSDPLVLINAPSPKTKIMGEEKSAIFVVDTKNHTLYQYDNAGNPICAYLVATGRKEKPTHKGVRIVSHVEQENYKTAPRNTVRYNNPSAFGPRIILLKTVDPETGKRGDNGEYIHGNNDPNSLGKSASGGCVRMDNKVIIRLSQIVKHGDVVIVR